MEAAVPLSFPSNPAEFLNLPWYFVSDGATRGPVATRLIIHKIREGLLDGLSMVYSHIIGKWLSIAEIPEIRAMINKLDEEEDQAAALTTTQAAEHMVFVADDEDDSHRREFVAYCEKLAESKEAEEAAKRGSAGAESSTSKKSFVSDDGKKYLWDAEEDDWVECTASDSDGEEVNDAAVDDDNDNDDEDDRDGQTNVASTEQPSGSEKQKRKRKNKSRSKNNKGWVYITGLPQDITTEEIKDHFSKVGLIAISPYDQQPRIRIYLDESGACKGDCSLCFNAEASVKMAVDILSGGYIRPSHQISVSKADFRKPEPANASETKRPKLTPAQYKVAQSVMKNALAWNEDDDIGLTSAKGLKIVVLENLFKPSDFSENKNFEKELEEDIASECSKCGEIKKITIFSKNKKGVVVVKFATAFSAQECINLTNGRHFGGNILKSYFWDGVTNFSEATPFERDLEEKKEEERMHEFGDWLEKEQDDLPEEFQLRVEGD